MVNNGIDWNNPEEIENAKPNNSFGNQIPIINTDKIINGGINIIDNKINPLINEIESFGLKVNIDYEEGSIEIYEGGELVGTICKSDPYFKKLEYKNNLYFKIEENIRGKGIGTKLFELYRLLSEENEIFEPFENEYYANFASKISFLQKYGYEPISKIIDGEELELTGKDMNLIESVLQETNPRFKEEPLPFLVVLYLDE